MALAGKAAIAIFSEIDAGMLEEHDAWHGKEHFPERMAIPGFLRGRRTVAVDPATSAQRFILYEIEDIAVATSAAYLARLNDPTPWTRKVMAIHRLNRTLCRIAASEGFGVGAHLLVLRIAKGAEKLTAEVARIAAAPGIVGAHLLARDASVVRPSTGEEKLRRGADASAEWIFFVEGYSAKALDLLELDIDCEFAARYSLSQVVK